jgi:hypothetical protein
MSLRIIRPVVPARPPDRCLDIDQPATDVLLLVTAGAKVTRVWLVLGYCTGRGMTTAFAKPSCPTI